VVAGNERADVDRFAGLIRPVPVIDFVGAVRRWLQDAHEAAAELQPLRKNHRGTWNNNTSFGIDRYQYLLGTAGSLTGELPDLEVDAAFQSVLLKLGKVGVYQFQAPAGPRGSLGDASDLRRELLEAGDNQALFSRRDAWLRGRELLLLPWSGTEEDGLTGSWVGQGSLPRESNRIEWEWLVRLEGISADGYGLFGPPGPSEPLDPAAFEQPQPMLPIRPRAERPSASAD
jgi:hypothetical protein